MKLESGQWALTCMSDGLIAMVYSEAVSLTEHLNFSLHSEEVPSTRLCTAAILCRVLLLLALGLLLRCSGTVYI